MNTQQEIQNIQLHIEKGNYHAAINLAISAMNACRKNSDQIGVNTFLEVIQGIVDTMTNEFGDSTAISSE